jgi:hypothetical protein
MMMDQMLIHLLPHLLKGMFSKFGASDIQDLNWVQLLNALAPNVAMYFLVQ